MLAAMSNMLTDRSFLSTWCRNMKVEW